MASDTRKRTIAVSLTIAVALVVGAFYFSGHKLSFSTPVSAESTQDMLKTYASKDSDGDGLPDWQESLYGTDPNNAHSVRSTLTDSQAVAQGLVTPQYNAVPTTPNAATKLATVPGDAAAPGSITDQFSQLFFSTYMSQRGGTAPSATDLQNFVQSAIAELESTRVRADVYSATDMHVTGQGADALRSYAGNIDAAFSANTVQLPFDELTYFSDATEKNDASALQNVTRIGNAYIAIAKAASQVAVPKEAAAAHLQFVNAMAALGNTINDLASVNQDPIRAMLGLQEYPTDAAHFMTSLQAMNAVFAADDVTVAPTDPGASFYHLLQVAQTQVAAAQTP